MRRRRTPWRGARHAAAIAILMAVNACDKPVRPDPDAVATVAVTPDSVSLEVGMVAQLTATLRNAAGTAVARGIVWSSSNPVTATVSTSGAVSALAAGRAVITATSESRSDSAVVVVSAVLPREATLTDAQFTQAVQAADGSIPIVLGGNAAAVNVLVRCTPACNSRLQVVLRLYAADSSLIRTDTALTAGAPSDAATYLSPTAQLFVPAGSLAAGLRWQVEVDPRHTLPGDSVSNNVFPRSGRLTLPTFDAPPLRVRFVPIVLASHSNRRATITADQFPEYVRTLRSVMPLGSVTPSIGNEFTTFASFGTAPSGGGPSFWTQVLSELDLARVADPSDAEAHWFGLVLPPTGFNFAQNGGWAYIPASGLSTGAGTRTALAVQLGWFNDPAKTRELVAHELGHNFGRFHAPCGGAPSADPLYPVPGGLIGTIGYDVWSWATGATSAAPPIPPDRADVMGYCSPVWSSEYTYRGVMSFRSPLSAIVSASPAQVARVLVIRGRISGAGVALEPAFVLDGRPTRPERRGSYRLHGRAAGGGSLFAFDFEPAVIDHSPERHFTFAIPVDQNIEGALERVEVAGPLGAAVLERADGPGLDAGAIGFARLGSGEVELRCPAGAVGLMVRDATRGVVLAVASGPVARLSTTASARVDVSCSDGLRTAARRVAF